MNYQLQIFTKNTHQLITLKILSNTNPIVANGSNPPQPGPNQTTPTSNGTTPATTTNNTGNPNSTTTTNQAAQQHNSILSHANINTAVDSLSLNSTSTNSNPNPQNVENQASIQ